MHWCYSCSQCPLWVQRIIVAFHVNPPQLSNYSMCHWFSVDLVPTLPGVRCQVLDSQWPNQDGDCHGGFCLIAHPPASSEQICREQLWNVAVESPVQVVRKCVVHPMRGGQLVARGGPRSVAATAINQTAGPRQWSQFADLTAAGYWVGSQLGPSNKLINCNLVSLKVYPIRTNFAM